jgi:hypothetical protein
MACSNPDKGEVFMSDDRGGYTHIGYVKDFKVGKPHREFQHEKRGHGYMDAKGTEYPPVFKDFTWHEEYGGKVGRLYYSFDGGEMWREFGAGNISTVEEEAEVDDEIRPWDFESFYEPSTTRTVTVRGKNGQWFTMEDPQITYYLGDGCSINVDKPTEKGTKIVGEIDKHSGLGWPDGTRICWCYGVKP